VNESGLIINIISCILKIIFNISTTKRSKNIKKIILKKFQNFLEHGFYRIPKHSRIFIYVIKTKIYKAFFVISHIKRVRFIKIKIKIPRIDSSSIRV
jgi:hypothetical protein